jgi:hypothetical protein
VLRRASTSTLLVGPHVPVRVDARVDAVVACIDGSTSTAAILTEALRWAGELGVLVHALRVSDTTRGAEPDDEAPTAWTSQWLTDTYAADHDPLVWDAIAAADPAEAILAQLTRWDHPLPVLGSCGGGHHHAGLGHVASTVVNRARVPALVVPV